MPRPVPRSKERCSIPRMFKADPPRNAPRGSATQDETMTLNDSGWLLQANPTGRRINQHAEGGTGGRFQAGARDSSVAGGRIAFACRDGIVKALEFAIIWTLEGAQGTMNITLQIPDSIARGLRIPEAEAEERLRQELAAALYANGLLSFGKVSELA